MWEQIRANQTRSAVLVIVMAGVLFLIGYLLGEVFVPNGGGLYGLLAAFILWVLLTLISYASGDQIFLMMSGARKIRRSDHPVLYNVVEEMQIAAGLSKMPDIYIIDDDAPNAFATGRKPETASVAVTTGLLKILDRDELQGVIAHEMGHVRNRDVLYMMMVGVMLGAIVILADIGIRAVFWGGVGRRRTSSSNSSGGQAQVIILIIAIVLMILAPIIAQLIYLALSRRREYLADATSAQLTRYPEGLARALEKLAGNTRKLKSASRATAPMYIVNPLKLTKRGLSDISSTHPPISERIKILRAMGGAGNAQYDEAYRQVTGRPVGVVPASALQASEDVPLATPERKDETSGVDRFRQTTDMFWKMNGYAFIPCACGTKLKVPPAYAGRKITCPHCGASHVVPKVAKPN